MRELELARKLTVEQKSKCTEAALLAVQQVSARGIRDQYTNLAKIKRDIRDGLGVGLIDNEMAMELSLLMVQRLVAVDAKPWKSIVYRTDSLCGELPKHFSANLDDDTVTALYYSEAELREHMNRVYLMGMVRAAEALGGVVAGEVAAEDETLKQAVLMT